MSLGYFIIPYTMIATLSVATIKLSFSRLFPTKHFQAPMLDEFFRSFNQGMWITILFEDLPSLVIQTILRQKTQSSSNFNLAVTVGNYKF